jgi:beta-galactosidase beta subunit
MSIVQATIDNQDYVIDDKVICYFAFPRIGVAVALRPGDFLLFNPREPHSISSRCRREDDIYIISYYLKTAVVGLNDNSNPIV